VYARAVHNPKIWLAVGAVLVALGLLEILSGVGRLALLAAGVLVLLLTGTRVLRDESRQEPPVPPGSGGGW
jgi:hypothetical protein